MNNDKFICDEIWIDVFAFRDFVLYLGYDE